MDDRRNDPLSRSTNSMRISGNSNNNPNPNDPSSNNNNTNSNPNQNSNQNSNQNVNNNRNNNNSTGNGNRRFRDTIIHPDSFLGRIFNRGSNNSNSGGRPDRTTNNNRNRNNNNKSWAPWAFLGVIVLFGVLFTEKIPFVFDRGLEENFNLFLTNVESTSPYPMGNVKTGNPVYDKNLITADMVETMGSERYFVYVFKRDEMFDVEFNDSVLEYIEKPNSIPVYRLDAGNALENGYEDLFLNAPKIIEYTRLDDFALPIAEYVDKESWKSVWEVDE